MKKLSVLEMHDCIGGLAKKLALANLKLKPSDLPIQKAAAVAGSQYRFKF